MADLTIDVINDKDLLKLFNELIPKVQNRIILGGYKQAGKIILSQAKSNLLSRRKNKSLTGYKGFNSMFKTSTLRKPTIGAKVGLSSKVGYKYRFQNFGTAERQYRTKTNKIHKTGKISASHFFDDAVNSKKDEALRSVNQAIVDSMNKTVKKYERKYRK